jgi:hypothetical protein
LKRAEADIEALRRERPWKPPTEPALDAEQLTRFLEARGAMGAIFQDASFDPEALEREPRDLREVGEALEGVGDLVARQLDVYVKARMSPAEYHYVERLIYRRWRPALQRAGAYPATLALAAGEVEAAAAREARPDVARRLRDVAAQMRRRAPPAPPGVPEPVHALLLGRVEDIERWSLDEYRDLRTDVG